LSAHNDLGRAAEQAAREHLERNGLRLIQQNWSCRCGELDLVMLDGDTVVFAEVRARRHSAWGGALGSIDARKRNKLINAAQMFLQQHPNWARHPCRFDVVAISTGNTTHLDWIKNAFDT
jgi:putative endonuclease